MKIFILTILQFYCSLIYSQKGKSLDSSKVISITKYKNNIGLYPGIGGVIGQQSRFKFTNDVFIISAGLSYDRVIYKRYFLSALYTFTKNNSHDKLFFSSRINTIRVANKIYLKKTKDHIFLSVGVVKSWEFIHTDSLPTNSKQANLTVGFGFSFNLCQLFKFIKTDRFYIEYFSDFGLKSTTFYPNTIAIYNKPVSNPAVSLSTFGIKYHF